MKWVVQFFLLVSSAQAKEGPRGVNAPTVLAFTTTLDFDGLGGEPDSAWETCTGGAVQIEAGASPIGGDTIARNTPGHKYVDTLTLRGPLTAGRSVPGRANEGAYEVLENGAGKFKVDIAGCPTASGLVDGITMEDLLIDTREVTDGVNSDYRAPEAVNTSGVDWDYRVYGPGDAHYGSITIRSRVGKNSKELQQWFSDAAKGKNIRKNITITLKKRDGSAGRVYGWFECYPVAYQPFVLDGSARVASEEITVRCDDLELSADGERKALMDWVNSATQAMWEKERGRRTIAITEITRDGSAGRTFTYQDAFPVRLSFPRLSADGTGNLYEEISLRPMRLKGQ